MPAPPLPVTDDQLKRHIVTTLGDVFTLLHMASHYNTRSKTVYYKCAFILLASVVEALVYHFIECHTTQDPTLIQKGDSTKLKSLQELHSSHTGSSKKLWLAEEVIMPATFGDITKDFNKMNDFCKKYLGISERLYKDLNYVRKKRNEIHLQGLTTASRSYTKVQINKAGTTMIKMLNELETINPT